MSDSERHRYHDRPRPDHADHPLGPVITFLALLIILILCLQLF